MKCQYCAEEIGENQKNCPICKESLVSICKFCKEEIATGAIKCKHCGSMQNAKVASINSTTVPQKNTSRYKVIGAIATSVLVLIGILFFIFRSSDLEKAKEFVKVANYQQAVVYFDKYIDKKTDNVDAYIGRGYCALMLGDYTKVDQCVVSAFKIKPDLVIETEYSKPYEEYFTKSAKESFSYKDYESAYNIYSLALQCSGADKANTWNRMGVAKFNLSDKITALTCFTSSFKLDKTIPIVANNIANCYDETVDPDSVIKYMDIELANKTREFRDDEYKAIYERLRNICFTKKDFKKAALYLQKYYEYDPNYYLRLNTIAWYEILSGNYESAIKFSKEEANSGWGHQNLILGLIFTNNLEQAKEVYNEIKNSSTGYGGVSVKDGIQADIDFLKQLNITHPDLDKLF